MTYLEMCQKMVRDLGLQNTVSTVEGQTGMAKKIVDWVADADVYIQSLWKDWNFLWSQFTHSTIASTKGVSAPDDFGTWDKNSFYLNYTSDDYIHLQEMDYLVWRELHGHGTQEDDEPNHFIILPNHNLYLDPAPDGVYTLTADYWKEPTRMSANGSISAIPSRFHRIVLAQAKIFYAEHDEFPTVFELATKEFDELYDLLKSAELPGHYQDLKASRNPHEQLKVVPE